MMHEHRRKSGMKATLGQHHLFVFKDFSFVGLEFLWNVRGEEQIQPVGPGFQGNPKHRKQRFTKRGGDYNQSRFFENREQGFWTVCVQGPGFNPMAGMPCVQLKS